MLEKKRTMLNTLLASRAVGMGSWMTKHHVTFLQEEIKNLENLLPLPSWDKHADYLLQEIQSLPHEAQERVMLYLRVGLEASTVNTNCPVQVRLTSKERTALEAMARTSESPISSLIQHAVNLAYQVQEVHEVPKSIHSLDKKVFARLPLAVHRRLNVLILNSGMTASKVLRSAIVGMLTTHEFLQ